MYQEECPFNTLVGKTLVSVENTDETVLFVTDTGEEYQQIYYPDCCAHASVEDIVGDLKDLVGTPILKAEESSDSNSPKTNDGYADDSSTWTFYHIATVKGAVTIRWYGSSNGYYSEAATFERIK